MKSGRKNNLDKVILSALSVITDEIAADVLRRMVLVAPSPGLGIDPAKAKDRQREWLSPLAKSAHEAGRIAASAAFRQLFLNPELMSLVASFVRSQSCRKANGGRENRAGRKSAVWRNELRKLLVNKRFIAKQPDTEEIIDRLINDCVIDEDNGAFYCHETGNRIATTFRNLAAEISKVKSKVR